MNNLFYVKTRTGVEHWINAHKVTRISNHTDTMPFVYIALGDDDGVHVHDESFNDILAKWSGALMS